MATDRARLVEEVAVEGLRRVEELETELLAEGAVLRAADETLAERDEELLRSIAPWWVEERLGDNSVWLNDSVMLQAKKVRDDVAAQAYARNTVMLKDWLDNMHPAASPTAVKELEDAYYGDGTMSHTCWRGRDFQQAAKRGTAWRSKAAFDDSRRRAAIYMGERAEERWIGSVVTLCATDATMRNGLDFWDEYIIEVEYTPDNPKGLFSWRALPRDPGNPRVGSSVQP
jgi:hypothetical protein